VRIVRIAELDVQVAVFLGFHVGDPAGHSKPLFFAAEAR
jgi:hypothetical protein